VTTVRATAVFPVVVVIGLVAGCGGGSSAPASHHRHKAVITQTTPTDTTSPLPTHTVTVTASPSSSVSTMPSPKVKVTTLTSFTQFQSPTKNVGCEIEAASVRCDIKQRDWSPPAKPANCPLDYGQGIQIFKKSKAQFVCAGDTALDPQAQILAYGHALQIGDMQCTSEISGMTCENLASTHAFTISRESYHLS
jgi:hypothetical protein